MNPELSIHNMDKSELNILIFEFGYGFGVANQ